MTPSHREKFSRVPSTYRKSFSLSTVFLSSLLSVSDYTFVSSFCFTYLLEPLSIPDILRILKITRILRDEIKRYSTVEPVTPLLSSTSLPHRFTYSRHVLCLTTFTVYFGLVTAFLFTTPVSSISLGSSTLVNHNVFPFGLLVSSGSPS